MVQVLNVGYNFLFDVFTVSCILNSIPDKFIFLDFSKKMIGKVQMYCFNLKYSFAIMLLLTCNKWYLVKRNLLLFTWALMEKSHNIFVKYDSHLLENGTLYPLFTLFLNWLVHLLSSLLTKLSLRRSQACALSRRPEVNSWWALLESFRPL